MAIIITTDMYYTRPDEATESNVLSAHNPLIWEFYDDEEEVDNATVQFVVRDNNNVDIYDSPVFPAYMYDLEAGFFRFDGTQIVKHIIDDYFYKETSEVVEPENYGSVIVLTIKTYTVAAALVSTKNAGYLMFHAINQIGDEYGSNIPRLFYNDTEEIAHFLGFPNHLFFYTSTDLSAETPLINTTTMGVDEFIAVGGSFLRYIHDIDLSLLKLTRGDIQVNIAYEPVEDVIIIKTYNLTIFEPCENAVYIRWLTKDGYYMYWAFSPYPYRSVSGGSIGSVINSFSEMAKANSRNLPIGYRGAFSKIDVIASAVPMLFRRKLMDLFTSPAVYIWQGQGTPNLGESIVNSAVNPYETLTVSGATIVSAINTTGSGQLMLRPLFTVKEGDTIIVVLDLDFTLESGLYIRLRAGDQGAMLSNAPQLTQGFNIAVLVVTAGSDECNVIISNTAAINFSTSEIVIKRKEIEADWILLDKIEGSHTLREKMKHDNFKCTLVLPENYTQTLP